MWPRTVLITLVLGIRIAGLDGESIGRPVGLPLNPAQLFAVPGPATKLQEKPAFDAEKTFDEVWNIVSEKFWDPQFNGVDWLASKETWREQVVRSRDHDTFAAGMNQLLSTLKTSHTRYYSRTEPRYYQLLGVFQHVVPDSQADKFTYAGVGIETVKVNEKHFVQSVYDGFPADQAGVRFGDEIVNVDGQTFHPIHSFSGRAEERVVMAIRRSCRGQPEDVKVQIVELNGRTMFEHAMEASVRIIPKEGNRIGYVHLWSYAGPKYHEKLQELIFWGKLAECDALVVDLRDGWGGASPDYVNLFREPIFEIESESRSNEPANYTGVWGKPVALLINQRTTSGKELFAYAFKKLKLGKVIGTKTAGAVVAGQLHPLDNGDALYLAVADLRIDGQRLEGVGIEPDIPVERALEYAHGADTQLKAAIDMLGQLELKR